MHLRERGKRQGDAAASLGQHRRWNLGVGWITRDMRNRGFRKMGSGNQETGWPGKQSQEALPVASMIAASASR